MSSEELNTLVTCRWCFSVSSSQRTSVLEEEKEANASQQGTKKLYLDNTFLHEIEAIVVSATENELILDQSIFHPQGGGQPHDANGRAMTIDGSNVFEISGAKASSRDMDAIVTHSGTWQNTEIPKPGTKVHLTIDAERRLQYAKIHTGGHVIDLAMAKAGYQLPPLKGYHFPDGAYVEYDGTVESTETLVQQLNKELADIVAADLPILVSFSSDFERTVSIAGEQACACGGTHLTSTKQLDSITVTKAKHKNKKPESPTPSLHQFELHKVNITT